MQITLEDVMREIAGTETICGFKKRMPHINLDKVLTKDNYLVEIQFAIEAICCFPDFFKTLAKHNIEDFEKAYELISRRKKVFENTTYKDVRFTKLQDSLESKWATGCSLEPNTSVYRIDVILANEQIVLAYWEINISENQVERKRCGRIASDNNYIDYIPLTVYKYILRKLDKIATKEKREFDLQTNSRNALILEDVVRATYGIDGVLYFKEHRKQVDLTKIVKEKNYLKNIKPVIRSLANATNQPEWFANPRNCLEAIGISDYKSAYEYVLKQKEEIKDICDNKCFETQLRKLDANSEKTEGLYSLEAVLSDKTIWLGTINVISDGLWHYQEIPKYYNFLPLYVVRNINTNMKGHLNKIYGKIPKEW